jgi:hypothetical protein
MSTRAVAHAILAGELPYDVEVAAPGVANVRPADGGLHPEGARKWLRAVEVPVIAEIVESEPTTKLDAPPVSSYDEARTPRQRDDDPVGEGPTPASALPPTRPAFGGQSPPTTRPYRKLDETERSPEMLGNAPSPSPEPGRRGGRS